MLHKTILIIIIACAAAFFGCDNPYECSQGEYLTPGCAEYPEPVLPAAGCYQYCSTDDECMPGETCTYLWIDPCGSSAYPNTAACQACGALEKLCLDTELVCDDCTVYDDL